MSIQHIISYIEVYFYRRKIKKFTKQLDKLPKWIIKGRFTDHNRLALQKSFKLAMLQLFNPKTKQEKRDLLKTIN